MLRRRHFTGHSFSIVVVAEGALPAEGTMPSPEYPTDPQGAPRFGGIAYEIRAEARGADRLGEPASPCAGSTSSVAGPPVAADRIVATRFGIAATDLIAQGGFGQMVALHGDRIGEVPLAEAARVRPVPEELVAVAGAVLRGAERAREDRHPDRRRRRPGLNACIKAATLRATEEGHQVAGIRRWLGRSPRMRPRRPGVRGREHRRPRRVRRPRRSTGRGGTILHTSRTNPARVRSSEETRVPAPRSTTRPADHTRTSSRCSTAWASTR